MTLSKSMKPIGYRLSTSFGDFWTTIRHPEASWILPPEETRSSALTETWLSFRKVSGISNPNAEQIKTAKEGNYEPGGDIMIHGYPNKKSPFLFKFKHRWKDWTAGCIAVTNDEIEEIYAAVKDGTPITIKP